MTFNVSNTDAISEHRTARDVSNTILTTFTDAISEHRDRLISEHRDRPTFEALRSNLVQIGAITVSTDTVQQLCHSSNLQLQKSAPYFMAT